MLLYLLFSATYTYSLNITIDKIGKVPLKFTNKLKNESTPEFMHLAKKVHEALDRTVMQSDLRDIFHGVHVTTFNPTTRRKNAVVSNFYLQLSDEINESRIEEIFKKYLRNSNYSLGGTDVYSSSSLDNLKVEDFNECENPKFHDCSENAQCLNQKGTYGCSCKEGYSGKFIYWRYSLIVCFNKHLLQIFQKTCIMRVESAVQTRLGATNVTTMARATPEVLKMFYVSASIGTLVTDAKSISKVINY